MDNHRKEEEKGSERSNAKDGILSKIYIFYHKWLSYFFFKAILSQGLESYFSKGKVIFLYHKD